MKYSLPFSLCLGKAFGIRLLMAWFGLVFLSAQTFAAYVISLTGNGSSSATVAPGASLTLDVSLNSDASDQHNSAVFRLAFSAPGLVYESYQWAAPYQNGTTDDDSKPLFNSLPVSLAAGTLAGAGYPTGVVDVELSNVIDQGPNFGTGKLVTLTFQVPANYSGPATIALHATGGRARFVVCSRV